MQSEGILDISLDKSEETSSVLVDIYRCKYPANFNDVFQSIPTKWYNSNNGYYYKNNIELSTEFQGNYFLIVPRLLKSKEKILFDMTIVTSVEIKIETNDKDIQINRLAMKSEDKTQVINEEIEKYNSKIKEKLKFVYPSNSIFLMIELINEKFYFGQNMYNIIHKFRGNTINRIYQYLIKVEYDNTEIIFGIGQDSEITEFEIYESNYYILDFKEREPMMVLSLKKGRTQS